MNTLRRLCKGHQLENCPAVGCPYRYFINDTEVHNPYIELIVEAVFSEPLEDSKWATYTRGETSARINIPIQIVPS